LLGTKKAVSDHGLSFQVETEEPWSSEGILHGSLLVMFRTLAVDEPLLYVLPPPAVCFIQ
jgi:hypothetical protein